ncbi:MAG TPA: shikimate kinase [Streptosporangiaceae bacterium]|jgi:shikimate kinase|nr:shikimate kinase [Streptosporangiaceae bacterium]
MSVPTRPDPAEPAEPAERAEPAGPAEQPEQANQAEPIVILIGPPGAGKTTVGQLLAERLGVSFTDTDTEIEATAGKPVGDIFIEDGESVFRDLERTAVARALGTSGGGVLAVGGGAVLDPQTQERLAGRPVVYLETGFAAAAKRTGLSQARPLLIGTNPRATLKALLDQRLPVYQRLAWMTVGTDDQDAEQVAAEIAARLSTQQGAR